MRSVLVTGGAGFIGSNLIKKLIKLDCNIVSLDNYSTGLKENEVKGVEFCNSLFGHTNWIQTSYNHNMRKQFAGTGFTYDDVNDVFVAPQPYPSWSLDENHDWQPPTPMPEDDNLYTWNEETQTWDVVESE